VFRLSGSGYAALGDLMRTLLDPPG
jgi:hypothetical protein